MYQTDTPEPLFITLDGSSRKVYATYVVKVYSGQTGVDTGKDGRYGGKYKKVILIGVGNRGMTCVGEMKNNGMAEKYQVVAVAEPIVSRRNCIKEQWDIPDEMCFEDYKLLLALGKIADLAVIATMDRQHLEPTLMAIELGYDLLLEKPIAPTPEECVTITKAAIAKGVDVVICTVLRYTPLFVTIRDIIDSGRLGEIKSVNHEECVGHVHQSHSFVRGNWGNSERSSTMLLQKCCHDFDILQWLLRKRCLRVQSFGALSYFTQKNAPAGSPDYCMQGCPVEETCPYYAKKLYLDDKENDWFRSTCMRIHQPTDADVLRAITETQYGKCVYKCDNDVVDHQTVHMLFEDDITVTFSMNAFNKGGRRFHIFSTKGELHASLDEEDAVITVFYLETKETESVLIGGKDGTMVLKKTS